MDMFRALLVLCLVSLNFGVSPATALNRSEIEEVAKDKLGNFKEVFPAADVFAEKSGRLPHYKAYKADPASGELELLGFVFVTDEVEPDEFAYGGTIEALVGLTLDGTITHVKILRHIEPFGYFSIDPPEFPAQFEGKSILDPFRADRDIDAVTGASITVDGTLRVIRKSARAIARQYLQEQEGQQ